MAVILDRNENDLYRLAVRAGILKGLYSRNQFDLCTQKLYTSDDMSLEKEISLRQAIQEESKCGGQGYAKCNCTKSKNQCKTNKCKCFKLKQKCNSRCHSSLPCYKKKEFCFVIFH